jgi:hypothetical protein
MGIFVQRGEGLNQGPDIVDGLLSNQLVMVERGRVEIDASSTALQKVYLSCRYRSGVKRGQLVEVSDALQGETYRGKVVGLSIQTQGPTTLLNVTLVRPTP